MAHLLLWVWKLCHTKTGLVAWVLSGLTTMCRVVKWAQHLQKCHGQACHSMAMVCNHSKQEWGQITQPSPSCLSQCMVSKCLNSRGIGLSKCPSRVGLSSSNGTNRGTGSNSSSGHLLLHMGSKDSGGLLHSHSIIMLAAIGELKDLGTAWWVHQQAT